MDLNLNLLVGTLTGLTIIFFLSRVANERNQKPEKLGGETILKPSRLFYYLGVLSIIIGASMWLFFISDTNRTNQAIIVISLISAFFLLSGTYLCAYVIRYFVKYSEKGIVYRGLFGKTKEMDWSDVKKITFSDISTYLKLKNGPIVINIYPMTKGFDSFINKLKEKISPQLYQEALDKMEKMMKKRPEIWS
ncbi:MAG: hypothetical protein WC711_02135 [Candidatus Staskawiczbacteria bacterium]|jgi:hypothetical protein